MTDTPKRKKRKLRYKCRVCGAGMKTVRSDNKGGQVVIRRRECTNIYCNHVVYTTEMEREEN